MLFAFTGVTAFGMGGLNGYRRGEWGVRMVSPLCQCGAFVPPFNKGGVGGI